MKFKLHDKVDYDGNDYFIVGRYRMTDGLYRFKSPNYVYAIVRCDSNKEYYNRLYIEQEQLLLLK